MEPSTLFQLIITNMTLIVQTITSTVLILSLIITFKEFQKSIRTRRQDLYMRLELASIDIFKMEILNPKLMKIREREFDPEKLTDLEEERLYELYLASLLNLFEIHFNLKLTNDIDTPVFASWLPWLYEICQTSYFKKAWKHLQKHYVPKFRDFINSLLEVIDSTAGDKIAGENKFYEEASRLLRDVSIKRCLIDYK